MGSSCAWGRTLPCAHLDAFVEARLLVGELFVATRSTMDAPAVVIHIVAMRDPCSGGLGWAEGLLLVDADNAVRQLVLVVQRGEDVHESLAARCRRCSESLSQGG